MKRSIKITAVLTVMSLLLCALAGLAAAEKVKIERMETQLSSAQTQLANGYFSSLQNAADGLRSLETDLSRTMLTVEKDAVSSALTTLSLKSANCSQMLSQLPTLATGLQNTLKFTNQLSSYCVTVLHSLQAGSQLPENFDDQIAAFLTTCRAVNEQLSRTEDQAQAGELDFSQGGPVADTGMFSSIADDVVDYPAVIFDGPFSDGEAQTTPKEQREPVSQGQAQQALEALGFSAQFDVEIDGTVPVYQFRNGDQLFQITKEGGLLLLMLTFTEPHERMLTPEDGETVARELAKSLTDRPVHLVWTQDDGTSAVYNFTPMDGNIVLYPDLFKIRVSLEDGEILAVETNNYVMAHHARAHEAPAIGAETAAKKLREGFEIREDRLCVIPYNGREYLAYEFFGTFRDMTFAVYFSAVDGREITSFRILDDGSGRMAE